MKNINLNELKWMIKNTKIKALKKELTEVIEILKSYSSGKEMRLTFQFSAF